MSDKTAISRIRKRYVRVVKIGDQWNTYLQIDQQGFCVVQQTTKKRATWYAQMLAVALARLIDSSHACE
jgi:hypothetical protein